MGGTLFSPVELASVRADVPLVPRCGPCGLYKQCKSPKMRVYGRGLRKIMVVGEAPGEREDSEGRPFVGPSGYYLARRLREAGIDLFRDCWVVNALRCRPGRDNKIKDPRAVDHCRPFTVNDVKALTPDVIVLLGGTAVRCVVGWLWKEDPGPVERWAGWRIPSRKVNAWVCPTWHPSYVLRSEEGRDERKLLDLLFLRHIAGAASLKGKPYDAVPDPTASVRACYDPSEAARFLDRWTRSGVPVAFDFETDRLKPDHPDARILCCSVSDGDTSVAFPWAGDAVAAAVRLLKSNNKKVGWNQKFESRWCRRVLGVKVRNWAWDGLLAAHALDNRKGTKSLKFQSFVTLGAESHDDQVKPYMRADGGNNPNKLKGFPLGKLLVYCGLDSLYEFQISKLQAERLGVGI